MKSILLIAIVLVLFASTGKSQEKITREQKEVQATVINMFEALSNRDSVGLKTTCTADIRLFEYGMVWNLDTLLNKAIRRNQAPDFKRINTLEFIDTKVDQNIAWATYYNQADITRDGEHKTIKWIETIILIRENTAWKVNVLHSTLLSKK
jgi:hypothetical protein